MSSAIRANGLATSKRSRDVGTALIHPLERSLSDRAAEEFPEADKQPGSAFNLTEVAALKTALRRAGSIALGVSRAGSSARWGGRWRQAPARTWQFVSAADSITGSIASEESFGRATQEYLADGMTRRSLGVLLAFTTCASFRARRQCSSRIRSFPCQKLPRPCTWMPWSKVR